MHISFILIDPAVPENVGFCARGLTTMGFADMRIVGNSVHQAQGARNTAYGAHELLETIRVFPTLEAAVADCELVVGTTAKARVARYDYLYPERLREVLNEKPFGTHVALVFGSETNGLSRKDIEACDLLTSVPMQTTYPSLNLAQAVMIYAYEMAKGEQEIMPKTPSGRLTARLKSRSVALLSQYGYDRHPILKQRILDRLMTLGEEDMGLVLGIIGKFSRGSHGEEP